MTTATPTRPSGQLVLPGQTAAPDGPIDLTVMFAAHHAFRRDLDALARAAAVTPAHDRSTWRALGRRWEVFSGVLHHHHSGEDAGLWPLLLGKVDAVGDVEGRAVLEAMEAEHAEIDPLLQSCAAGFAQLAAADDADARAALAVRLVAAREHLTRHLRHEETEALVLAQRHLTPDEWHWMEEEHFNRGMSAFQRVRLVGWILHAVPPEALRRLSRDPATRPMVLLGRLWLSRRFARQDRRAMRYLEAS